MADRGCRGFRPNVFNKNKCQNCYKLREAHGATGVYFEGQKSDNEPKRLPSAKLQGNRVKTVVKSGVLSTAAQESLQGGKTLSSKWQKRWFVLSSSGILECYLNEDQRLGLQDSIDLDDCSGMFVAEFDTGDPFSIGIKLESRTYYLKADNRLELDNWFRVLKPFIQAAGAYTPRSHCWSSSSDDSNTMSDITTRASNVKVARVHSFGSATISKPVLPPRSSSTYPKTRLPDHDRATVDSLRIQLEKLREENQSLHEQAKLFEHGQESSHILEQELKNKSARIKALERENSKAVDYQKAVIFQEKELQEARGNIRDLKRQLEETERRMKQQQGKVSLHAKELEEARSDLREANSIISIHKASNEALKNELSFMRQQTVEKRGKTVLTDEEPESDQVLNIESSDSGEQESGQKKDLESKLMMLKQKIKQNELELIIKTRELEKANESRSKVAKYTRSLLQELEAKLSDCEKKLTTAEEELIEKSTNLELEQQQRARLERENVELTEKLEKLIERLKKLGLTTELELHVLNGAKQERTTTVEYQLKEAEEKLKVTERTFSNDRKRLNEEINRLKAELSSAEVNLSEKETKLREKETDMVSANEELDRLRDNCNILKQKMKTLELENKNILQSDNFLQEDFQEKIRLKEEVCLTLDEENQFLKKENTDLNRKYNKIENQHEELVTTYEKLRESWNLLQKNNENLKIEKDELVIHSSKLQEEFDAAKENILALEDLLDKARDSWEKDKKIIENQNRHLEVELDDHKEKIMDLETKLRGRNLMTEKLKEALKEKDDKCTQLLDTIAKKEDEMKSLQNKIEENVTASEQRSFQSQDNEAQRQSKIKILEKDVTRLEDEVENYKVKLKNLKDQNVTANKHLEKQTTKASSLEENLGKCEERIRALDKECAAANETNDKLKSSNYSLQKEIEIYKEKLAVEQERILEYDVEEKLLSAELLKTKKEDNESSWNKINELEKKLIVADDKNKTTEQQLVDNKKQLLKSEEKVLELAEELAQRLKLEEDLTVWVGSVEKNLSRTENELCKTKEVLISKANDLDNEKTGILDTVRLSTKHIHDLEMSLAIEKQKHKELEMLLSDERDKMKDQLKELKEGFEKELENETRKFKDLETRFEEEKNSFVKGETFPQFDSSQIKDMQGKLDFNEREQKIQASQVEKLQSELEEARSRFSQELEDERKYHQREMKKISDDALRVSGAANTETDELKLRLTSRVITLQSDISELKAAHQKEVERLRTQYKKEVANARREAILECTSRETISEEAEDMNERLRELDRETREMRKRYEAQMENLKKSHEREMEKVRRSSDSGVEFKVEVAQLQSEMERMNEMHIKEIEDMQKQHAEELDQLKQDMAIVLQASITTSPAKQQENESNTKKLKARIQDLEDEMEELRKKYNEEINAEREKQQQEIEQTRQDMMMVIQAIRSEKYSLESDAEDESSPGKKRNWRKELEKQRLEYEKKIALMKEDYRIKLDKANTSQTPVMIVENFEDKEALEKRIKELEAEVSTMKQDLSSKESLHGKEVEQLKSDMLVAIQVARSGASSPVQRQSDDDSKDTITSVGLKLSLEEATSKIECLQNENENMKKEFKKEKEKSEAAIRFGLRRNEEMSNKIYIMQKEMEDVDRRYQKEIQMYKEAFEREKQAVISQGTPGILASENEELRIKLEELKLKFEEKEVLHESEIKIYKDKLDQEKIVDAEEMLYKIKSLEGVIDEMKFEYETSGKGASSIREKELENRVKELEIQLRDSNVIHEADMVQSKELKNKVEALEKELVNLKSNKKETKASGMTSSDSKLREYELKIEELESLLNVKRKRHREEVKELKEKLESEIQSHSNDSKELRRLQRTVSDGSTVGGDYVKRRMEEQRLENQKLREELEKAKGVLSESDSKVFDDGAGSGYFKRKLEEVRNENRQLKVELENTKVEQKAECRKLQEELEKLQTSSMDDQKSKHYSDGMNGDYYKVKFEEQEIEIKKLQDEMNTLKSSSKRRSSASDSEKEDKSESKKKYGSFTSSHPITRQSSQENRAPFQFITPQNSSHEKKKMERKGSLTDKEPLRKAISDPVFTQTETTQRKMVQQELKRSDSRESKRPFLRQSSADESKGKKVTRQSSKKVETSSLGSVASRVAMYQTAVSKGPEDKAAEKQRKY